MYLVKREIESKSQNIEIAKQLLLNIGLKDFIFCDYSFTDFGVSVYFLSSNDKKIRVSDHSVTNNSRMQNEMLFSFDSNIIGLKGISFKDNQKANKLIAKNCYKMI